MALFRQDISQGENQKPQIPTFGPQTPSASPSPFSAPNSHPVPRGPLARANIHNPEHHREIEETADPGSLTLPELLGAVVQYGGSDLHVPAQAPTKVRVSGRLRDLMIDGKRLIIPNDKINTLLGSILSEEQTKILEEHHELDFAYDLPKVARFRCNYYYSQGVVRSVFRLIPHEIRSVEELGLPLIIKELARRPRGLVLMTGPTGSGKSTSLAAMIDEINRTRECHILTIEDPVEFLHTSKKALVSQRELGTDTYSFGAALRAALREDPDVILIGEMRDPETIQLGLTAAETGHLVFATLHTQDASQSVDRMIDSFPPGQQGQIRAQLSLALQGIVTQQLVRAEQGNIRLAACEVLTANNAVRNVLREGKSEQLYSIMQTSSKDGMQTMDMSLAGLIRANKISRTTAANISSQPSELDRILLGGR
jgi:twitching motility protein PilT